MTVEIDFPTGEEAANDLEKVLGIDEVIMRFELVIDGESVLTELSAVEYYADWFYMFLKGGLRTLPTLYGGDSRQFGFEGTTDLHFESDGQTVTAYLVNESYQDTSGDRYEMALQAFAREVIETSEEFLDFALDVRLDARGRRPAEEFEEALQDAREWYRETYDEAV
jgi:hypothetical protein